MATLEKAIPIASTFIKKWEGKPKTNKAGDFIAFNDGYDNPTIGSGITYYPDGSKVKYGDIITPAKGEQYFQWQIQEKTNGITDLIDIDKFTDNQVAALISFAYTTGVPGLAKSKLLKAILAGTRGNELRALWIVSYITSNGEFFVS
jgi:GH24 family phage-related lysozyme (muramidase)